jgi:DNA sulfur modification protein DndE
MLPTRGLKLPKDTEEFLRRLKSKTKVTPNVLSRVAFFRSVEGGYRYTGQDVKLDGTLVLDKITWLGELELAIDCTLQMLYPGLEPKELEKAWAAHVADGARLIRTVDKLVDLV